LTLSVCVPVHDPTHEQFEHLVQLIQSISYQTLLPNELVLTSNHDLDYLADLLRIVNNQFKVTFLKNNSKSSPENTNFAVLNSRAKIIKLMHQDDFFSKDNALRSIISIFNNNQVSWQVSAFDHLNTQNFRIENPMIPSVNPNIVNGANTLGAPSVVAFRKNRYLPFDDRMCYMFDCDWYLKMLHKWGEPAILKESIIRIRLHSLQATNWANKFFEQEVEITKKNHENFQILGTQICRCTMPGFIQRFI